MFELANPFALLLLLPLAVAAWFPFRRSVTKALLFAPTARIPKRGAGWRVWMSRILPVLALIGLALSIIALARPRTILSRSIRNADAIAIEMVTDVSGSMNALDLATSLATGGDDGKTRLAVVKEVFADFVNKRPDDLIGLISFGGYASTRVPLTADHRALLHVLKGVEIPQSEDTEETLTAIGDALATACARLESVNVKSRIIVLLSDGVSNTGIIKPQDAAEAAKKLGFRVYTIGVGTTGNAPFLGRDIFGRVVRGYAPVELDEKLLKDIATKTGGTYFNVRTAGGLEDAMDQISKLEKTSVSKDILYRYRELFFWFLVPGLCLVALGTGLNMAVSRRLI